MSKGTGSFIGAKDKGLSGSFHYSTWLVLVVGALFCQLLLAACGDNTVTTAPATTAASSATTAAAATTAAGAATTAASGAATTGSGGPTVAPVAEAGGTGNLRILIHQNKPFVDYMNATLPKFSAKYPNIKVALSVVNSGDLATSIQTRLSAKDLDLFETAAGFTNAPQPFMKNVTEPIWLTEIKSNLLLDLSNQPFIKNYDANALKDASTYNGGIYSLTTGRYAYSGVFYNKDIFTQNNLKVPTTWSEFTQVADALKAKGIAPMTAGGKDVWPIGAVADSGLLVGQYPDQKALVEGIWTGKIKFTDPASQTYFSRGAQFLNYFEKGVNQIDYNTAPGRFASGKSAMYPGGTWDAPTILQANPNIKLGYFPFPGSDDASANKTLAGKYDVAWFVPNSGNTDAALKFLNFFSQPDNYAAYANAVGILPTQPNVTLTADYAKELSTYLATFKVAYNEMQLSPKNVGKYGSFDITNLAPIGDVTDPKDLATKAQADWDAGLKS